jgi:cytochrome c553
MDWFYDVIRLQLLLHYKLELVRSILSNNFAIAGLLALSLSSPALADESLGWAFPGCPGAVSVAPPDNSLPLSVPGSQAHFTAAEIANWSLVRDWFPLEHSSMPSILGVARPMKAVACAYCHLPDGNGRPENAKLAGLPASYILTQMKAFRSGARQDERHEASPGGLMIQSVSEFTDEELAIAAAYYSRQVPKSYDRIVEQSRVPGHEVGCFIYVTRPGTSQPIGKRIVELPISRERFERRDPHALYVAYVPTGSIERGRRLAITGGNGRSQFARGPRLAGTAVSRTFPYVSVPSTLRIPVGSALRRSCLTHADSRRTPHAVRYDRSGFLRRLP